MIIIVICFVLTIIKCSLCSKSVTLDIINQIELANKATLKGSTIIGVNSNDNAVLINWRPNSIRSHVYNSKIIKISENLGVSLIGINSDANYILDIIINQIQDYKSVYNSLLPPNRLVKTISKVIHRNTLKSFYRPFGIRMCFISYDIQSKALLQHVDSYGNIHISKLTCLGPYEDKLIKYWPVDKTDISNLSLFELITSCIAMLNSLILNEELDIKLSPDDLEIVVLGSNLPMSTVTNQSIKDLLSNLINQSSQHNDIIISKV